MRVASVEEGGDKAICSIILRVHWTHQDGGRERTNTAIYIGKWPKFLRRDRPRGLHGAVGPSPSQSIESLGNSIWYAAAVWRIHLQIFTTIKIKCGEPMLLPPSLSSFIRYLPTRGG